MKAISLLQPWASLVILEPSVTRRAPGRRRTAGRWPSMRRGGFRKSCAACAGGNRFGAFSARPALPAGLICRLASFWARCNSSTAGRPVSWPISMRSNGRLATIGRVAGPGGWTTRGPCRVRSRGEECAGCTKCLAISWRVPWWKQHHEHSQSHQGPSPGPRRRPGAARTTTRAGIRAPAARPWKRSTRKSVSPAAC